MHAPSPGGGVDRFFLCMYPLCMVVIILLACVLILLIVILVLQFTGRNEGDRIISHLMNLGIDEKLGRISKTAEELEKSISSIEDIFKIPQQRGYIGEVALETILSNALPPDTYGIRERIPQLGKIPDAFIKTDSGIICIDSKFPLENYTRIVEGDNSAIKEFRKNLTDHLKKVKEDYVRPESGTTPFALVFIPSEAVYYYIITNEYEMVMDFARSGVQVVSPLTLSGKLQIIRAGIHAGKLSKEAKRIREDILSLSRDFRELEKNWQILLQHIRNASTKSQEVDTGFRRIKEDFRRMEK
ncbi:hypothetical protein DRQ23_09240 [bacterium]|nr:MAG: hypothetical protein DRQ23_09240 [bacterium]